VQQPDISVFIIFSGQAKENLPSHLPPVAGKKHFAISLELTDRFF